MKPETIPFPAQNDIPVAVVTGATSGIGREIALGLARAGYQLVLIGRNRERGEAVLVRIKAEAPSAQAELIITDLSLLAEARETGRLIADRHPRIALLVNNAGAFDAQRIMTSERHERVLATNLLSPFVLTQTLLPALKSGAPSRIVNVGSSTSDRAHIDGDFLELGRRWAPLRAYSRSKLALMMTTFALARKLEGSGVTANVVHPGTVATGLVRAGGIMGLAWKAIGGFALTEAQGADTPLYVALSPELETASGLYFKKRRAVRPNRRALDAALIERVWTATERLAV